MSVVFVDQETPITTPQGTELVLLDVGGGVCESLSLSNLLAYMIAPITATNPQSGGWTGSLMAGQRAIITYTSQSSFSVPIFNSNIYNCVYAVTLIVETNSSTSTAIGLWPNYINYGASFTMWSFASSDLGATTSPYLANTPQAWSIGPQQQITAFTIQPFYGPNSSDTINARGPLILNMIIDCGMAVKCLHWTSGIAGGASSGYGFWPNFETAWQWLGTFTFNGGNLYSGKVIVERLV